MNAHNCNEDVDDDEWSTVISNFEDGIVTLSGDGAMHTAKIMRKWAVAIGRPDLLERIVVV